MAFTHPLLLSQHFLAGHKATGCLQYNPGWGENKVALVIVMINILGIKTDFVFALFIRFLMKIQGNHSVSWAVG